MVNVRGVAIVVCAAFLTACGEGSPGTLGAAPSTIRGAASGPATASAPNAVGVEPRAVETPIAAGFRECATYNFCRGGTNATPPPRARPIFVSVGIPPAAQSATISAAATGRTTVTATVNCSNVCRTPLALAPSISWLFSITAYSGLSGTGNALRQGSIVQTILPLASNQLDVTFNPVVASVILTLSPGALTSTGSATVSLTPLDASGASIIGSYAYEASNGSTAPLVVGFANVRSTTLADFSPPAPFVSPPPSGATLSGSIQYDGQPVGLQFPILAVTQGGSNVPAGRRAAQLVALPSGTDPGANSYLSHFSITYGPGTNPDPYVCFNDSNNNGAPTIADVFGGDSGVVPTNFTFPSCGTSTFDDNNFWWYDGSNQVFGVASLDPVHIIAYPVAGCTPNTSGEFLLTAGSGGFLWFAVSNVGGSQVPQFGQEFPSGAYACNLLYFGNAGDTITGLVAGSDETYLTLQSKAAATTQLYSATVGSAPVKIGGALPVNISAIGYAPYDGNLYVQSSASPFPIYGVSPSTGAASLLCSAAPQLLDVHHQFAELPDGTLAYVDDSGGVTRIAPGVGCATIPGILTGGYYLFAISPDGSSIINSNGGNIAHVFI